MFKILSALLILYTATASAEPVPLVFWHGMGEHKNCILSPEMSLSGGMIFFLLFCFPGDSCCFPFSLGKLIKVVADKVPGIYLRSIEIGDSVDEDVLNGFFYNVNDQIDLVCKNLTQDANLKDGFNVIGFSQGGQFW